MASKKTETKKTTKTVKVKNISEKKEIKAPKVASKKRAMRSPLKKSAAKKGDSGLKTAEKTNAKVVEKKRVTKKKSSSTKVDDLTILHNKIIELEKISQKHEKQIAAVQDLNTHQQEIIHQLETELQAVKSVKTYESELEEVSKKIDFLEEKNASQQKIIANIEQTLRALEENMIQEDDISEWNENVERLDHHSKALHDDLVNQKRQQHNIIKVVNTLHSNFEGLKKYLSQHEHHKKDTVHYSLEASEPQVFPGIENEVHNRDSHENFLHSAQFLTLGQAKNELLEIDKAMRILTENMGELLRQADKLKNIKNDPYYRYLYDTGQLDKVASEKERERVSQELNDTTRSLEKLEKLRTTLIKIIKLREEEE